MEADETRRDIAKRRSASGCGVEFEINECDLRGRPRQQSGSWGGEAKVMIPDNSRRSSPHLKLRRGIAVAVAAEFEISARFWSDYSIPRMDDGCHGATDA